MNSGTITELDPYDSLGWIELDNGERVRFGGSALKGFQSLPGPGARVWVEDIVPGFRGVPKATAVRPLAPAEPGVVAAPSMPNAAPVISWRAFVDAHPRWSDLDEVCLEPELDAPPLSLAPHAFFAPWHQQLIDSTPIITPLSVPDFRAPNLCDPTPHTTFAQGLVAFLEHAAWPTCGRCSKPLEHCIQLAPAVMLPWGGKGRGFVAMFCFECGIQHREDPRVVFTAFVEPRVRVTRAAAPSASSTPMQGTRRVEARPAAREPHSTTWYRYRSELSPDTAASALFGYGEPFRIGDLPPGWEGTVDPDDLEPPIDSDDAQYLFEEWMNTARGTAGWGGAALGGSPNWDQADATPKCHGPMRQLLEYEGGQFLDGALHVFQCVECAALRSVAEF